jgi:glutathione S-transferase
MITLHINGWTPPAISIAIALAEKGLAFETVTHDWRETAEALATFAGQAELTNGLEGEFPILVDNGTVVSDSYFVLEYIDDAYPRPAAKPGDAAGQWQVQAFHRFLGERALPAVSALGVAARSRASQEEVAPLANASLLTPERRQGWMTLAAVPDAHVLAAARRTTGLLFERLDTMLTRSTGEWLLGHDFALADIAAFALAHPFIDGTLEPVGVITDRVGAWHGRMLARTAGSRVLAQAELAFLPGPEQSRWG